MESLAIVFRGLQRTFSFLTTVKCCVCADRSTYQPSACSEVLQSSSTSFQGGIFLALIHQGQVGADGI